MAPLTDTSYTTNNTTSMDRPRHPTQPPGKLIPATVEIDEEGNPVFSYLEGTPQKLSPKIEAPRAVLNRLSQTNNNNHQNTNNNNNVSPTTTSKPPSSSNRNCCDSTAGPVVHHPIEKSPTEESYQHFSHYDDIDEDEDEENRSILSKTSSLASNSVANSIRSALSKAGFRRHNRKSKDKHSSSSNKQQTKQQPTRNFVKIKFKTNRRKLTESSAQSCTSRTTEMEDSSSFFMGDTAEPAAPLPSVQIPSPKELQSKTDSQQQEKSQQRPEPIPTLKAAMEQLSPHSQDCLNNRRMSTPTSTTSPSIIVSTDDTTSRRSSTSDLDTKKQDENEPPKNETTEKNGIAAVVAKQRPSSSIISVTSTSQQSSHPHYATFKIFILLLCPRSKIFELIQLFFNPTVTRIRDLLSMIPKNATEDALGKQTYTSLCRPNSEDADDEEISNMDLLVQNFDDMKKSAMIVRGEILVAVPEGYSAHRVAMLSNQILVNPRIRRLLESSDPLAPKLKRRTRKTRRRRRHTTSGHPKEVQVLERHAEAPIEEDAVLMDTSMMMVQKALENAASAAAASNAAIVREQHREQKQQRGLPQHQGQSLVAATGRTYRYPHGRNGADADAMMWSPRDKNDTSVSTRSALRSLDTSYGTGGDYTYEESDSSYSLASYSARSLDNSLDQSYTSWSKSLDVSFAANHSINSLVRIGADTPVSQLTNATMMTNVAFATTPVVVSKRRNKQLKMIRRGVVVSVSILVIMYFADANGYGQRHGRMEEAELQPLGLAGLIKVISMLLVFGKLQFLCRAEPFSDYHISACKCPLMRMRAHAVSSQGARPNAR